MKFFRALSFILCIIFLITPTYSSASNTCKECKIAFIKEGSKVPFDGVLYNNEAFANEQAERNLIEERFKLKLKYNLQIQEAELKYATATTAIALKSLKERYEQIIPEKNKRIKFLEDEISKSSSDYRGLWFTIGIGTGILTVIIGIIGLRQLQK